MSHSALTSRQAASPAPAAAPSVHPLETNDNPSRPTSYRSRLLASVAEEYEATKAAYAELPGPGTCERLYRLDECREYAYFAVNRHDRRVTVISNSCRLRWCPLCSRSRASLISASLSEYLRTHPRPKILTLTLNHSSESLDAQITRLYACFRALRRRRWLANKITTGVWFFQIKKSKATDQWHPHIHCLLISQFLPHAQLKQSWKAITGDSDIVDIRAVYNPQVAADYVARYSARPSQLSDLSLEDRVEVITALHGRRILGAWGKTEGVDLTGKLPYESSDFVKVVSWEHLQAALHDSATAAIIAHCYTTRQPLPESFDLDAALAEFKPPSDFCSPSRPPPQPDPYLPFY